MLETGYSKTTPQYPNMEKNSSLHLYIKKQLPNVPNVSFSNHSTKQEHTKKNENEIWYSRSM